MFGKRLHQARTALLSELGQVKTALVFGDGNGRFLKDLCSEQPHCNVTSVDHSKAMLHRQRERLAQLGKDNPVEFLHVDALQYEPPSGSFDLLVCCYFLDCFTESQLNRCLPIWLGALKGNGTLYFVDFQRPKSPLRRFYSDVRLLMIHQLFRRWTNHPSRKLLNLCEIIEMHGMQMTAEASHLDSMCVCRLYKKNETDLRP